MTTTRRRWQNILSVLTHRDFVLLWLGEGLSSLGIMTLRITLVNLIYELTGSASGVSLLILTHTLAVILVTPISGVLVDRFDRKRWLIGIGVMRALLACVFFALAGDQQAILFGGDVQLILGKTGDRHGDAVLVLTDRTDVVRGV